MRQNKGERQTKRISTRTKQVVDVALSACEKKFQKKIDEMHKYYRKEIDSLHARIKLLESEKRCEHETDADNEEIEEHHIKETNENKDNKDDSDDGNVEKLVCGKRKKFEEDIDHKESKIGYVDTKIGNDKEDQSGPVEKNLSAEFKEKDIEGEMSQVIPGNKLVNTKAMKTEVYMQTKRALSPLSLVKGVKQRENTRKPKYKEDDIYHIELRKSPTKQKSIVTPQGTVNESKNLSSLLNLTTLKDFSKTYNKKKKPIISPMQMMEINGSSTNKGESIFQTTNTEKQFYAKETNMECDFIQTNQSNVSEKDKDVINIENAIKHPSKVNNKLKRPNRPRITNKEFDTINVMERISLRLFISKYWQDRSNFLWRSHNDEIIINSTSVCRFLMNDPLDSDGIDGYMYILGLGIGMDILIFDTECMCISLRVQQYVLPFLKNGAEVTTVISKLTNSIKGLMWGITSNKCQKCRNIMVPIQGSWHYSLLVLDLEEKIYKAYNSDWTIDHST